MTLLLALGVVALLAALVRPERRAREVQYRGQVLKFPNPKDRVRFETKRKA